MTTGPWTPEALRAEARSVRHDNDDGGIGYPDPELAVWTLERLPLSAFMHIMSETDWDAWLDQEIDGGDGDRPDLYRSLLTEEIEEPIMATMIDGRGWIWDGYHRVGASVAKAAADVLAIVGRIPRSHTSEAQAT